MIDQYRVGDSVKLNANDKLRIPKDPKEGVTYQLGSVQVDASTGTVTARDEGIARFYLPVKNTHEDKAVVGDNELAVYAGNSYDIALEASPEGFSTYVVVRDNSAPTDYRFRFELSDGVKLSEDGNGGIEILNEANQVVAKVASPWATDANGVAVPTEFKLSDGLLIQEIDHIGAVYPVVADPSVTLGWHIYVWFDVPDEVDSAGYWYAIIQGIGGLATCTGISTASGGVAGAICGFGYIYWGVGGAGVLDDVIDDLPSDPPDDCQLVLAFTYIGLLNYVEHSACGTDVKETVLENLSASQIWDLLWGDDD